MMFNKIFNYIKDDITYISDNFNERKLTCLEYGGLKEELLRFKHGDLELSIMVDPECFYNIDGVDYIDSMVSELDIDSYKGNNYYCWYMNYFYIIIENNYFKFHDFNEDFDTFKENIERIQYAR